MKLSMIDRQGNQNWIKLTRTSWSQKLDKLNIKIKFGPSWKEWMIDIFGSHAFTLCKILIKFIIDVNSS